MWRHYLSVAARGIVRHRLYSAINIASLAVGLTCIIFVILFVRDELSYDKWVPDTANLYRVELTIDIPGRSPLATAVTPYPMPAVMREQIPAVTGMTRLYTWSLTLTSGDRQFPQNIDVVDPGFFKVIRLPLIKGDAGSVFREPESVVLSQSVAKQYFGDADPIGRIVTADEGNCDSHAAACPQVSLAGDGDRARSAAQHAAGGRCFHPHQFAGESHPGELEAGLVQPERLRLRPFGAGGRSGDRGGGPGADLRPGRVAGVERGMPAFPWLAARYTRRI